jgi:hypothetical protein
MDVGTPDAYRRQALLPNPLQTPFSPKMRPQPTRLATGRGKVSTNSTHFLDLAETKTGSVSTRHGGCAPRAVSRTVGIDAFFPQIWTPNRRKDNLRAR